MWRLATSIARENAKVDTNYEMRNRFVFSEISQVKVLTTFGVKPEKLTVSFSSVVK